MRQYKAYPAYKDSGVEWIGLVPEHWKIAQIKRISVLNPKKSTLSEEKDSLCTFLPMEKLRTNAVTLDETRPIHEVYGGYSYFCDDDILIAKVTPCFENGNIAVANGLVNGIGFGSTEINVLRVNEKGHNRFLYYRLQEEQFRTIAKSEMRGTGGLKRVPTELFESFTIGLPDTDEQASIAATLDRETARIDALVEKKTRFIELLKEKRQALITHAVTKGLDHNVKMKDSGVEWIGEVPEHWKIAQIKRISALNPRKSTLSEEKDSLCTFLPMEKLRTNAVTLDETRPIHEVYGGYSYFSDGDILIAKVTPCFENGNIAVANGLVNGIGFGSTEINVLRVNGKGHNRFLYYRLQEEQFRTIAKSEMRGTGGLKRVPTDLFESFTIGLPDTDEQATIAATLDRETARIDTLIGKAEQSITLLKERRAAFITAAVTGQIDLRGKQ
ncbi:TPA: restriction endonuclease subunit S [Vibrio cholerae]